MTDKSEKELASLLQNGDVNSGHRSAADAIKVLPAIRRAFGLPEGNFKNLDPEIISYTIDVILGAAWYCKRYKRARLQAIAYVALNIVVICAVPIVIASIGKYYSTRNGYDSIISQLTTVLTGVFALQKTVSAWYAQQQNYAGWYKCSADLKENYYTLLKKWAGHVSGREIEFVQDLQDGETTARRIMDAERIEYYTRLALPSFDVLDMLTSSKATVTSLVTALVPDAKATTAIAVGTKAIIGAAVDSGDPAAAPATDAVSPEPTAAADSVAPLAGGSAPLALLQTASLITARSFPQFDQNVVDACAAISISNASDIANIYQDRSSFFDWYNFTFRGVTDVSTRYPCSDTLLKRTRFDAFWNQINAIYGRASVSAIDFCALMAINLEESSGDLSAAPEGMNKMTLPHPGLAYAFDRIPGKKQSYNHTPNRTALSLFQDALYVNAHTKRPGKDLVVGRGSVDPRWGGDVWPAEIPANVDASKNGFIMQADFYKFRGRGVIQTTWRDDYKLLIEWILSSSAAGNAVLQAIANRWTAAGAGLPNADLVDVIATISTNEDWDAAFGESLILAQGVAIDSRAKGGYLDNLSKSAEVLDSTRGTSGSLLNFASHINGGNYPDRVAPIMKALMCGIAETVGGATFTRPPRSLSV